MASGSTMIEQLRSESCQAFAARWWVVVLPVLLLAGVCAGHIVGTVREDYGAYLAMFAWARTVEWNGLLTFPYRDYGFGALLFLFAKLLPASDALWFFLIAMLGLGVKFYCFQLFSPAYWVAMLVHVALFFVLHDYTQLRASLGIAFLMLGVGFLVSRGQYGRMAGSWLLAASFHVQTLFAMLLALTCVFSMAAFLGGTALSLLGGKLFTWASSNFDRLVPYLSYRVEQTPNPFSSLKIYQYLTLVLFLYYRGDIRARGWKMVELSGWFLLAGLGIFIGLLRFPAVAHRLSEMLFAFMPFLVSGLFVLMPKRFSVPYVGAAAFIGAWASYRILFLWQ